MSYNPLWHLAWKMTLMLCIRLRDDRVNLKDKTVEYQCVKCDSPCIYAVLPLEHRSPQALFHNQDQICGLFSHQEQMQRVRDTDLQTFAKVSEVEYLRGMSFWIKKYSNRPNLFMTAHSKDNIQFNTSRKHAVLSLWKRHTSTKLLVC